MFLTVTDCTNASQHGKKKCIGSSFKGIIHDCKDDEIVAECVNETLEL